MRQKDANFDPSEELYRSVEPAHLDGERVLEAAVEAPACSFNRSKYGAATSVLADSRPSQSEIAVLVVRDLPASIDREPPAKSYEFLLEDDPCPPDDPENLAHAEVRISPRGETYDPDFKPKSLLKKQAREKLADAMRRYKRP